MWAALLTRMSSRPNSASVILNSRSVAAASLRSVGTPMTRPFDLALQRIDRLLVAFLGRGSRDHDMPTLGQKLRRHRIADAAIAAGDDGDAVSQSKIH